jgi:hypothetical protein
MLPSAHAGLSLVGRPPVKDHSMNSPKRLARTAGASTTAARNPGRSKAKAYGEDRDAGSPATESPGDHGHQPSTSSALTDQREVLVTPR